MPARPYFMQGKGLVVLGQWLRMARQNLTKYLNWLVRLYIHRTLKVAEAVVGLSTNSIECMQKSLSGLVCSRGYANVARRSPLTVWFQRQAQGRSNNQAQWQHDKGVNDHIVGDGC